MRDHVRRHHHHGRRLRLSSEERRKLIVDAALNLFAEKGFSGARTKEIARAAGVSETLIFQHFRDKEELYREALQELFSHHPMLQDIEQKAAARDDAGVLRDLALHVITHSRLDRRIIRLSIFSALEGAEGPGMFHSGGGAAGPMPELLADYFRRRVSEGAFAKIDPDIAARLFIQMVDMYVADREAGITGPPLDCTDEEAVENMVRIFLHGMKA